MPPPGAGSEAAPAASRVGTPGPVGTGGHRTGSVPNARLCGLLNLRPTRTPHPRCGPRSSRRPSAGVAVVAPPPPEWALSQPDAVYTR